ncbi:alpha/beta hydrolase [Erythrobacter sp. QSSC1-22B]|uniref:alpha/beta hydrolase n=1 Tax=Erythrobacter sp. QSSC1-22B TaxID=1860125 RepID=UPI0011A8912F|nr:hypothetical protein [Erythrobacter sp. QSSC1-22B]
MIKFFLSAFVIAFLNAAALAHDRTYEIETDGQKETIFVWDAHGETKGVVLFGHGWGGQPANYARLIDGWTDLGFTVEAPLNLDSDAHLRHASLPPVGMPRMVAIVGQRMETLLSLREAAKERGLPVVLAGHSFGGFVAMSHGEGKWFEGPLEGPEPAAVIAFSSPGALPPLVSDATYSSLDVPFMMVTGTNDSTGTSMPTWEVHRFAFDRSNPGDKYLVVVVEGGHNLDALDDEELAQPIITWSGNFLSAYASADASAKAALASDPIEGRITVERR